MSARVRRRLVVEADGGSRGNPGPAGFGALVRDAVTGAVLAEVGERCGRTTNNVAEYSGLVAGLQVAAAVDPGAELEVRMDSKLVVEQMSGRWKIKDARLAGYAEEARTAFDPALVRYTWVPRGRNAAADRLANEAMDGRERPVATALAALADPADHGSADGSGDGTRDRTGEGTGDPTGEGAGDGEVSGGRARARLPRGPMAGARRPDLGSATTVLLVRHGRTRLTQEQRLSGAGGFDAALTAAGREDAVSAVPFLRQHAVDAVVVSPLARARQTAALLGESLGWAEPEVDDRWAEAAFGDWDSLTAREAAARDPELFARWVTASDVRPPGGESMADVAGRVLDALDDVLVRLPGRTVAVVTHMTPVRAVVRRVLDAGEGSLTRLLCLPGSLTTARFWADGGAELDGVGLHVPPAS